VKRVQYYVATTVDGFIARSDGAYDCFVGEGEHAREYLRALEEDYDTVLMGRETYRVGERVGVTDPYPKLKSYVFSRTLAASPDPKIEIVSRDAAGFVRQLRKGSGRNIYLCGGGQLAGLLFAEDLIDDVMLKVSPVILGSGIPLASIVRTVPLELVRHRIHENGVVFLHYRVQR
jgi:dihydrofolate reductase